MDNTVHDVCSLGISFSLSPALRRWRIHAGDSVYGARGTLVRLSSANVRSPQSTGPTSTTTSFLSFFFTREALLPTAQSSTNMVALGGSTPKRGLL